MTQLYLDGSRYQGQPDFAAVKASGVTGVVWNDLDPSFAQRCQESSLAGLSVGAYHYLSQGENAVTASQQFWQRVQSTSVPMVLLALDIEEGDGDQSQRCLSFLDDLARRSGLVPWLYSGSWFVATHLTDPALARYPLWDAAYQGTEPTAPAPWTELAAWQYTSSGTVPGIQGGVDLDYVYHFPGGVTPTSPIQSGDDDAMSRLLYRGIINQNFWFTYGRSATQSEMDWWCAHAEGEAGGYEWALEEMWAGSPVVGQDFHNAMVKIHSAAS